MTNLLHALENAGEDEWGETEKYAAIKAFMVQYYLCPTNEVTSQDIAAFIKHNPHYTALKAACIAAMKARNE